MSKSSTALQERPARESSELNLGDIGTDMAENGGSPSLADQVLTLNALVEPAEGLRWLGTPQARLGGSPTELIERGQSERILHMLIRLEEGVPT